MFIQVELTTRCNFDCFYCAGRDMEQVDMPFSTFKEILDGHISQYGIPSTVSLQGEGEPSLHKQFFEMAEYVKEVGSTPYSITNGTHKHPDYFIKSFDQIGVSIDTLNPEKAEEIGRYNLERVLAFVESIKNDIQVTIHTVAFKGEVEAIANYCKKQGLIHVVQPLQTKPDYSYRYDHMTIKFQRPKPFACSFLSENRMRFYDMESNEKPCCFIKETNNIPSIKEFVKMQEDGVEPSVCTGCQFGL